MTLKNSEKLGGRVGSLSVHNLSAPKVFETF